MQNRLSWDEIQAQFDQRWVELIDYEWDDAEPYPQSGVVRCHATSRKALSQLVRDNPVDDSAILFVGDWKRPASSDLHSSKRA